MNSKHDDHPDHAGRDANRDPISGTPGSHPVGVGVGGAAGGMAAGAAAGTVLGPIGTMIGAAIGVVAGAAVGKRVAERIDPTGEEAYWREAHKDRPYVKSDYDYDRDYSSAYGFGLQARESNLERGWDESESSLRSEWDKERGESRLSWDDAQPAVRDAWDRADRTHQTYRSSDSYFSENFDKADYRGQDANFDDYQPAYRYGTQARSMYADRDWDESLESELSRDWGSRRGNSKLDWDRAKPAVRDAFTSHDRYSGGSYSGSGGTYAGSTGSSGTEPTGGVGTGTGGRDNDRFTVG